MFKNFINGFKTAWKGLTLTIRHLFASNEKRKITPMSSDNYFKSLQGTNTIQYPKQQLPVPEVGRYQQEVENDDCIVCDLCAKICPVDCIDIESIKATEAFGQTSDGSPKRIYAAKFDIDMETDQGLRRAAPKVGRCAGSRCHVRSGSCRAAVLGRISGLQGRV